MNEILEQGRERRFQANGLTIAGLTWGDPQGRPVLALHGWLDNAASFAKLAPRLIGCFVVALDLTGHGRSDRRADNASYHIWDDLPEILAVLDELGWHEFDLVGHSRGAIISTLLAAAFPERIRHLVLLDGVAPDTRDDSEFVPQLRKAMLEKPRLLRRKNRVYATPEEAIDNRTARGLSGEAARLICLRNLTPCAGGYTWTTDLRLHGASAVKLSPGQIDSTMRALIMPVLLMLSDQHPRRGSQWMFEFATARIGGLEVDKFDAGHHFHMEDCAPVVAQRILDFFAPSD